jgi:hypothetical protein
MRCQCHIRSRGVTFRPCLRAGIAVERPAAGLARDWFFNGSHGRWAGYALGYELVKARWVDGFDLEASLSGKLTPAGPES